MIRHTLRGRGNIFPSNRKSRRCPHLLGSYLDTMKKGNVISGIQHDRATTFLLRANKERQGGLRTAIAMSRISADLRVARRQVPAIEALEQKADPKKASYTSTMIHAFIHVHLHVMCWAAIGRMIGVIRTCSGLEAPNRVWKEYRTTLECDTEARNHVEHDEVR